MLWYFGLRLRILANTVLNRTRFATLKPPTQMPVQKIIDGVEEDGGGAKGNRTPDLVIANDALYQLSYRPT